MASGTLVPTFTFGPNGFVAPQPSAVLTGVQGDINAAFGNVLNFALNTPQGQIASSEAASLSNAYQTFQFFATQVDPAFATGRMQDAIGRIYSISRKPAVPTVLQVSCTGGAGVVIPINALLTDTAGNQWACQLPGTIPSTGSIVLPFACTVPGPVAVPQANAIKISQVVTGWDTATVVSGVQGVLVESRANFEQRRRDSVAGNSQGPIGAILGAVSKVANIVDYFGYSNNTAAPVIVAGVTIPANSIFVVAAGGADADVAQAILTKKSPGAPMFGNKTVTAYDSNPLLPAPQPYQITFERPTAIQILVAVVLVNNPSIPSDAATQIQNALIAAMTGNSTLVPAPPRVRIGTTVYAAAYAQAITSLGAWAQIAALTVGSINTNPVTFFGNISGTTLTVTSSVVGTIAVGQTVFDADNRVLNGTVITAGSGTTWTVNQPQTVAGATFTGSGSGTNLTASAVTGLIGIGDIVTGTGVPSNTTIVSQTSGTPGGAGVYVTSNATTSSGASLASNAAFTLAVAASSSTAVLGSQVPQITAPNIQVTTT